MSVDTAVSSLLERRIKAFCALGTWLDHLSQAEKKQWCTEACRENAWFSAKDVLYALEQVRTWLHPAPLQTWTQDEQKWFCSTFPERHIALLLAGNIPLVGFHDVLCTLLCGHIAHIKPSSKDSFLLRMLTQQLIALDTVFAKQIVYTKERKDIVTWDTWDAWDALIATGHDHTLQAIRACTKTPQQLLRGPRGSCAILHGNETQETLAALGEDVFRYYGQGCRSVSLLYVPESYPIEALVEAWQGFSWRGDHAKYRNNYRYHKALYATQQEAFVDGGFFLLRAQEALLSPLAVVHTQRYRSPTELKKSLLLLRGSQGLQIIVSEGGWWEDSVPIGTAHTPELGDYADGIHTLAFLQTADTF